ncbi:hypothetical protein ACQUY5_25125 [Bacillus cereus]|uniref:hypothetical protein n=1 Tax=Bacillus cereus TaxID=1396 RepID=UPI003D185F88
MANEKKVDLDKEELEELGIRVVEKKGKTYYEYELTDEDCDEDDGSVNLKKQLKTQEEILSDKRKKRKKTIIILVVCFILFIVLPIIEGFQNEELLSNGKTFEAEIVNKHVETEKIIFTHPTLDLWVDHNYEKVWVKSETYDYSDFGDKVRIVKSKDGSIKLNPKYQYEELIVKKKK